jgi:hypothetical protein
MKTTVLNRAEITPREWRRVIALSFSVMAITAAPYLVGAFASTPDRVFSGLLIHVEDLYSYLAKMNQGAHGAWLFHLPYTASPQPGIFLYEFYLLLGKLSALIGWPLVVTFHVTRLILGFSLLLVIYRFIAEFVRSPAVRWIAFGMIGVMGGTGWLNVVSGHPLVLDSLPIDLILPEGFTFLLLYAFPHLILARMLLLWGSWRVWRAGETGSRSASIGAGVIWLAMSIVQPVYGAVVIAIAVMMFAARSITARRLDWQQARVGILPGVMASGMALYTWLVFRSDPIYGQWGSTPITSPTPLLYALTYVIPIVLAMGGGWHIIRRHDAGLIFLVIWMIVGPLMLYAPTNVQRRLIEGWQLPLSVMAAYGLVRYVLPMVRRAARSPIAARRLPRASAITIVALMTPTYVLMLFWHIMAAATPPSMFFEDGSLVAAANWLNQNATYDDGVLASYPSSTILPSRAGVRVLLGHPSETVSVVDRRAEVAQFFQSATSDQWRRDLLNRFRLDYVLVGPSEKHLGDFDPTRATYLKEVFAANDTRVYQVLP